MVQRCLCVLLAEYQSRRKGLSAEAIAQAINGSHLPYGDVISVRRCVAKMESQGSYYRNLENALGKGATLALGGGVSETM